MCHIKTQYIDEIFEAKLSQNKPQISILQINILTTKAPRNQICKIPPSCGLD